MWALLHCLVFTLLEKTREGIQNYCVYLTFSYFEKNKFRKAVES